MDSFLNKLYYDPKTGYVGVNALYHKAKELKPGIKLKTIKEWYNNQVDIQRYQEQPNRYETFKIASSNPDAWQMDLAFWEKIPILMAININSRIGYGKLLKNKQAVTVLTAMKVFVKLYDVSTITTDNGSEFMNAQAQSFFKSKSITHYNNEPGDHRTMGKIERFNRTIKARLTKMGKKLTSKLLSDAILNYNNTKHRSIGMTPNQAKGQVMKAEIDHNNRLSNTIGNRFEIGTTVLYRLQKKQFGKEDARWSKAVYEIVGIDGYRIQIRSKNGHTLYKSPNELKFVNEKPSEAAPEKDQIFEAEQILDHEKMKNGKYRYLVQWIDLEPSWERQDNLRLINKNQRSTLEKEYWKELKL